MSSNTTPVNFRVPVDLKNDFERTCRSLNLAMTAQLIFMMREFVEREAAKHREKPDDDNGPLSFFISST
ncbi:hypothetical protein [Leisingera sp. JC11]|uniref:hypothetical protein n=1 Tax=Leisingera sp. JC11 TaxID=3042469 RepID=UPI003456C526